MRVKKIVGENFANIDKLEIEFPETGIVLVTGENGHGKSAAFVETLACGLWKQTMRAFERGSTPWREDGFLQIDLEVGGNNLTVNRTQTALRWGFDKPKIYETATKAQTELEKVIGAFDSFSKSCVIDPKFSGFATASDRVRKELLESILGLDRFVDAEIACKAKTKIHLEQYHTKKLECGRVHEQVEACKRAITELDEQLQGLGNVSSDQLEQLIEVATTAVKTAHAAKELKEDEFYRLSEEYQKKYSKWQLEYTQSNTKAQELRDALGKSACPTCKRPFHGADETESMREQLGKIGLKFAEIKKQEPTPPSQSEFEKLRDLEDTARQNLQWLESKRAGAALRDKILSQKKARVSECGRLQVELMDLELELSEIEQELEIQKGCEFVLGPRGARAILLSEAVLALEPLTNAWLARLGSIRVKIQPFKTSKTGNAVDTISLSLEGAGSSGYGGASGGQQRRVDVASAFALADMARGSARGFDLLVLDEAVDSPLDKEGREGLIEVLVELSAERQIVVITHSEPVIQALQKIATRYHAKNGCVSKV